MVALVATYILFAYLAGALVFGLALLCTFIPRPPSSLHKTVRNQKAPAWAGWIGLTFCFTVAWPWGAWTLFHAARERKSL